MTKVRQTLLNLLGNACKFTREGKVSLRLGAETVDGRDWVVMQISDMGIGMTPEQMGKLFQAFSQADTATVRKYGGTGLGLTISRKFSEVLGGELTVACPCGARPRRSQPPSSHPHRSRAHKAARPPCWSLMTTRTRAT